MGIYFSNFQDIDTTFEDPKCGYCSNNKTYGKHDKFKICWIILPLRLSDI